ncbi:MAG: dihydrofolate reductase [Erysipelotrichaceae bacterium]
MISLVVAHSTNYCIGLNGWMPWHLSEDLKNFKKLTLNSDIVMGRTTYEAIGKPLPKRFTYIITRDSNYHVEHDNCTVCNDLTNLIKEHKALNKDLYICGGAQIYKAALPYVDEMWISLVEKDFEGDTYFPSDYEKDFIIVTKESKDGFVLIHYRRKL